MSQQRVYSRPMYSRHLGNTNIGHMEVHDLTNQKVLCQINEIVNAGHAVVFNPDTLTQAHYNGYDNCAYCIGQSLR